MNSESEYFKGFTIHHSQDIHMTKQKIKLTGTVKAAG